MNRYNLVFFIIFLTFLLPGPPSTPINSDDQYDKLVQFKHHLYQSYENFQNLTYDENWQNLTGFQLSYQDVSNGHVNETYPIPGKDYTHWEDNQNYSILPDEITNNARKVWNKEQDNEDDQNKNYYRNISATLYGDFINSNNSFVKMPITLPNYLHNYDPDLSSSDSLIGTTGNITYPYGNTKIDISIVKQINKKSFNRLDSKIKLINIDFEFSDQDESSKHSIETKGFYFVESGNIITSTSSAKFLSLYGGLQHLTFDELKFLDAKNLTLSYMEQSLFKTLKAKDNLDINFNYLYQMIQSSESHCEYIGYFHLNKVNLTLDEIKNLDEELINPIGRPIDFDKVPKLNLSGLLYSPDCAINLEIPKAIGIKKEIQIFQLHQIIIVGIILLLAQIFLIMKQMNQTNTPSTISRISFWSICLMSLVDGSLSMLYLLSSAVLNKLYLPLTVSAFLSFILASIFEMRYMISIYVSQLNERTLSLFTALQGRAMDDNSDEYGDQQGQPPQQQEQQQEQQPANDPIQDESQVSGAIYSRFFFTLIVFTFLILNSVMWPKHLRKNFEYGLLLLLNSYWLPQVYRNIIRGSHRSFKWWFIGGTTLIRTTPIFYIFVMKSNVFQHHYDPTYFAIVIAWLGFQILLLFLQEIFGARFFLPKSLLPQTYNYHPVLTEQDLESGFGIEHNHEAIDDPTTTINKDSGDGSCTIDCAICMNSVNLPVLKSNFDQPSNFIARRSYMVTPCRHIFHTQCLEAWMKRNFVDIDKVEAKWKKCQFLPGAAELIKYLDSKKIPFALATSSNKINFERKTGHLKDIFNLFGEHIVTGDDERIPKGRGKPFPDIWLAALKSLNSKLSTDEAEIKPEECLVFEDALPGLIAGKAAGAFVIWVPDHRALKVMNGEEHNHIAGQGELLNSLTEFQKEKYGL
ncbi:Transmembrane E3 ubiquitin-protein ligase 1 [Wickerhamomyces ciferrii]|uniref:RING-type E3 ubiquitin transferase n=1 Tax=Wickerhamomyces ciferrii (strain ATCC 14091 / BCRC 22168 / CBS 111 / JCM 3599 / NBRC 0793 / NRRL Y-1031 F-60-10) TaxID=1206466 RepID=K0KWK4_WICCF|nr:Transmembrane E3 ubiquitin-protein ligase 1 [Wickerhamomyces ciferrii]CCH45518.1 Transmembrane E3 ubiquitin-protein ligase 1 [Wickerhamomyces ciferrii]